MKYRLIAIALLIYCIILTFAMTFQHEGIAKLKAAQAIEINEVDNTKSKVYYFDTKGVKTYLTVAQATELYFGVPTSDTQLDEKLIKETENTKVFESFIIHNNKFYNIIAENGSEFQLEKPNRFYLKIN